MTTKQIEELLFAKKSGKKIECRSFQRGATWGYAHHINEEFDPHWDFRTYEYRVRPQPREWRVAVFNSGIVSVGKGQINNEGVRQHITVREVL